MESVFLECTCSDRFSAYETHFHNAYELIYVHAGAARFRIGTSCYTASAGSLLIISKLEEHSMEILEAPYRRTYIQLTTSQLGRCLDEPRLKAVFSARPAGFRHLFDLSAVAAEADRLLGDIEAEYRTGGAFSERRLSALLQLLLILCRRTCPDQFPSSEQPLPEAVVRAQAYLDTHFTEPISLDELAGRLYLSPSYLSHSFRSWTGYSPKQYLMLSRLSYARQLLLTTTDSVTHIAAACGFSDVNNFIRSFKKETGHTPASYRKHGADVT